METRADIERLIRHKREQLNLAIERHEFLEQYELKQEIEDLLKKCEKSSEAFAANL